MALAKEDIEEIKELIVAVIAERRPEMAGNNVRYELEIRERIVRVEEELKHQRELMMEGFHRIDKRFEQLIGEMNARFAQVDKRFEQVEKRFEQMEKRFEQMEKRFEQIDKRFEQVEKRFEQIDRRFEVMTARIDRFMVWSFATTLTVGGIVIAAIKYLP
jgi:DNA anti-recombination protein RmuC